MFHSFGNVVNKTTLPSRLPFSIVLVIGCAFLSSCAHTFNASDNSLKNPLGVAHVYHNPISYKITGETLGGAGGALYSSSGILSRAVLFPLHKGPITSIAVTKKGNTAYSSGKDGKLLRISYKSQDTRRGGNPVVKVEELIESSSPILALELSPDEKKLAFSQYSSVSIYDIKERSVVLKLTKLRGRINKLSWDPLGELLLLGTVRGEIYAWKMYGSPIAGRNNLDALERYIGATSPVAGLNFHPAGRSFVSVERSGELSVWRLLRTSISMGFRDKSAAIDRGNISDTRVSIRLPVNRLEGAVLDGVAGRIYAFSADGNLVMLKLRGLLMEGDIKLSSQPLNSLAIISKFKGGGMLAVSGREPRLRLVCVRQSSAPRLRLFRETELFSDPLVMLESAPNSTILWGAQKTGNLFFLDFSKLKGELNGCMKKNTVFP